MRIRTDRSRMLRERAEKLMPGGVNSPVRAFKAVGGESLMIESGRGSHIFDQDGNEFIDYVCSWGPLILGHANPEVLKAISEAAAKGTSFGASTSAEADLAELAISAFPHMEKVRFVNSGTEATMSAVRVARAFTDRDYIIKFEGCYHGHSDALLAKAGSGLATLGIPGSAGVPKGVAQYVITLPYNHIEAVREAFQQLKGQIACILIEPVVGNMGCVVPRPRYLESLREITTHEGALLIFDEVMTGFRLAFGGAQEVFGVTPDLTTFGKIIGGGLPVGAYGARAEIMNMIAPLGPVYQAGTLSGNPLAMAAGIATLKHLSQNRREIYQQLENRSFKLCNGVMQAAKDAGVDLACNRVGSMFTWFFQRGPVFDWGSSARSDTQKFGRFFQSMLESGVYLPPSQYEAAFLGAAHSQADIDKTIEAARRALGEIG